MDKKPLNDQEIIEMLAKLREETPEYPPELMKSRKSTFLKRVAEFKDSGTDQGGSDRYQGGAGGQSGWGGEAWSAASTGAAATGSSTKTAIAIGIAIVLITVAYLFRNQIVELLVENELITVEETATPSSEFIIEPPTETPTASSPLNYVAPTPSARPNTGGSSLGGSSTESPSGNGDDGRVGVPVTGGGSNLATPTPTQYINPTPIPGTSTPQPKDRSIVGRLRFLVCILRSGAENCE